MGISQAIFMWYRCMKKLCSNVTMTYRNIRLFGGSLLTEVFKKDTPPPNLFRFTLHCSTCRLKLSLEPFMEWLAGKKQDKSVHEILERMPAVVREGEIGNKSNEGRWLTIANNLCITPVSGATAPVVAEPCNPICASSKPCWNSQPWPPLSDSAACLLTGCRVDSSDWVCHMLGFFPLFPPVCQSSSSIVYKLILDVSSAPV